MRRATPFTEAIPETNDELDPNLYAG